MFGWDYEVDVRVKIMTQRSYFGKQNSTLGSVVPLAMFTFLFALALFLRDLDAFPLHTLIPATPSEIEYRNGWSLLNIPSPKLLRGLKFMYPSRAWHWTLCVSRFCVIGHLIGARLCVIGHRRPEIDFRRLDQRGPIFGPTWTNLHAWSHAAAAEEIDCVLGM